MKRWLWTVLRIGAILAVIAGIAFWMRFRPVAVSSHTVDQGRIVAEVMGTGTLEARLEATISPKIAGRIEEVVADQGDQVRAGDVLVRLDDEELTQQVAIARANLDAATAAIERLKTDKTRAVAVYDQAKASNERTQELLSRNAVSPQGADKATEAFAVATAGVSQAEAAIAEGQEELLAAEKTLEYHRARLQDTVIVAPFDGLITKRRREPGDVVVPGSSILTLVSTDELWISAWVDETEMARLQPDQNARVVFRSEANKAYPGKVVRLGKEADRETREFVVDVRVLKLPQNWAIGQRAEAFIDVAEISDALLLPAQFLSIRDGEVGVFLDVDGVARWRPVERGLRNRAQIEVAAGVQAGDVAVMPRDARVTLSDGKQITVP